MKTYNQFIKFVSEARDYDAEDRAFYNKIYRQAVKAGDRFPHVVAAQASLESDYGRSPSGRNNYFGQTAATGSNLATQEYGSGGYYNTRQTFADYDDEEAGTRNRVKTWGYKYGDAQDDETAVRNLQIPGQGKIPGSTETSHGVYATDPKYVSKIMDIQKRFRSSVDSDSAPAPTQSSQSTPKAQSKPKVKKIKFDNV